MKYTIQVDCTEYKWKLPNAKCKFMKYFSTTNENIVKNKWKFQYKWVLFYSSNEQIATFPLLYKTPWNYYVGTDSFVGATQKTKTLI